MLKTLLFILSFIFLAPAQAQFSCTQLFAYPQTAIESYRELALDGQLINQLDPRLRQLNLIVPEGGLCATTCAANVIRSFYEFLQLPHHTYRADRRIRDMAVYAREWGVDARMGLTLDDTAIVMKMMAERLEDFSLQTSVQHGSVAVPDLLAPVNGLNIIAVTTAHPVITHALVVLDVFPESQQIVISDPNNESKITYTFYEFVPHVEGWTTIRIFLNPNGPPTEGHIISVLHVKSIF